MAKSLTALIDRTNHLRDVYDSRRTPENKKKLQESHAEMKKALDEDKKKKASKTKKK